MSTRPSTAGQPPGRGTRTAAPPAPPPPRRFPWIDRTIEACWLAAAAFLPIFIFPETQSVGFVQVPKVFLLRSVALLAVALVVIEWAIRRRQGQPLSDDVAVWRAWLATAGQRMTAHPIVASAIAVVLVTVLSALLSPVRIVSIEGVRPGWDTYALYNVASWLAVFGLVAARMRRRAQVERLVWALTGASIVLGFYGIGQHFGIDPFRLDDSPKRRVPLTVGNAIFGASFLLMTIPLTLALWQQKRNEVGRVEHILLGAAMIALQLTAFLFTLARGGFLGMVLAMAVFAVAAVWLLGRQALLRPAASFGIGLIVAFLIGFIPVPGGQGASTGDVVDRFGSIAPELTGAGGLSDRYNIWRVAAEAYFTNVWPDTDAYPEVPGVIAEPLRPLIGYGPDMFGYVYNVVGDPAVQVPPVHAHNFPIHIAVELGLFGLAAYGALVLFVGWGLWTLLRDAKRGAAPEWVTYLLVGATAVFLGRLLEQMGGKAQVADITLAWVYAGVIVALLGMRRAGWAEAHATPAAARQTATRRRRQAARPTGAAPASVPHIVIAVAVAIGAAAFWWQAVGSTAVAASLTGRGLIASVNGDAVKATSLLESAIDVSPKSYTPRYVMSLSWHNAALAADNAADRRQYMLNSLEVLQPILDRDPLNRQAVVRRADVLRNLAAVDPAEYIDDTLLAWETVLALAPALWDSERQAATTFISYGRSARGLEVVESMRAQGAEGQLEENALDYMQAKALLHLGRIDEAQPYIERIEASDAENAADILEDLRNTQPTGE